MKNSAFYLIGFLLVFVGGFISPDQFSGAVNLIIGSLLLCTGTILNRIDEQNK